MSTGIIIEFRLNPRLLDVQPSANIAPSSYWGITVPARRKDLTFAGLGQEAILALVVDSAREGTQEAIAENAQLGLDSPGSRNGQIIVRKPGGELTTPEL